MKKKKISSNIINESDYSDNSINYSVLNLKEDNVKEYITQNHSEDNLKSIRKMLGDKSKLVEENNNKLKLILKQDIEGILIVMDDLNLDDKEQVKLIKIAYRSLVRISYLYPMIYL